MFEVADSDDDYDQVYVDDDVASHVRLFSSVVPTGVKTCTALVSCTR